MTGAHAQGGTRARQIMIAGMIRAATHRNARLNLG